VSHGDDLHFIRRVFYLDISSADVFVYVAASSRDSMDRRPDVQRNLELSGSTALTAFLDGSADVGSFSRWMKQRRNNINIY
jgi:ABC-type phosphate transport system substrate-binding protein